MRLLWAEIKRWLKNPVFYATLLIIALFIATQSGDLFVRDTTTWPEPPEPGLVQQENGYPAYGFTQDNSPEARMQAVAKEMFYASFGNPVTMPALGGFINRQVKLSAEQMALAADAFERLTGLVPGEVGYHEDFPLLKPYEEFEEVLNELNAAMGDSYFTLDSITTPFVPRTYEQAQRDYVAMLKEDKVTRAFARYYSDYAGIALGMFPVFLAAFVLGRDKRSGAAQLIGARPISSMRYVFVKYLGLAIPLGACVLLLACVPTAGAVMLRMKGHDADALAYLWHAIVWLLPTVLAVIAAAFFVSQVTGSGIAAIPVVAAWWAVSVARPGLAGPYPFYVLLIRFNFTDLMPAAWTNQIFLNRAFITLLAFALVALTGLVYDHKRLRGKTYA